MSDFFRSFHPLQLLCTQLISNGLRNQIRALRTVSKLHFRQYQNLTLPTVHYYIQKQCAIPAASDCHRTSNGVVLYIMSYLDKRKVSVRSLANCWKHHRIEFQNSTNHPNYIPILFLQILFFDHFARDNPLEMFYRRKKMLVQ